MSISRRDDWLTDAQGRALAGAQVYYCTQPASTAPLPPSPLATVYSNSSGSPATNPQYTDGSGHAAAYMNDAVLYTIVFDHPLFGGNPVILPDQSLGGGSSTGGLTPVQASTTAGTITGAIPGSVFTLPSTPATGTLVLQANAQTLTPNLGYAISGAVITLATALQTGDNLNANYQI